MSGHAGAPAQPAQALNRIIGAIHPVFPFRPVSKAFFGNSTDRPSPDRDPGLGYAGLESHKNNGKLPTMRSRFRILALLAVALLSFVAPAVRAQDATQQPVPPALDGGQAQACKRPVTVNEETKTWDSLETGADDAWRAYSAGDYIKAMPVFLRLAQIGHPVAEVLVGYAHFYGLGVPLDYQAALLWLEKAADQGCFIAYELTAQIYDQGLGTPVDFGKAYMWFNIAASKLPNSAKRNDIMKLREAVAAKMTQAQVEAAQKRSMLFEPKLVVPPNLEDLPDGWAGTN